MVYEINNIYFDKMTWTVDQGVTGTTAPSLTLKGISDTGSQTTLIEGVSFGKTSVSRTIDKTIPCNRTVIITPGGASFNMDFLYIYVDWVLDDEGYLGAEFSSNLSGWHDCPVGDF